MTKRKAKPTSPELARQMLEKMERKAEIARLQAQGVHVVSDEAKRITRAQRLDCFDLLLSRNALSQTSYDAVRRLEELAATASGALKNEQGYDRVDTTTLGQNITDAMIQASTDLMVVLQQTGVRSGELLIALLAPNAALLTRWRETVVRVTGEKNTDVHAPLIRAACENLAEAWRMRDYGRAA